MGHMGLQGARAPSRIRAPHRWTPHCSSRRVGPARRRSRSQAGGRRPATRALRPRRVSGRPARLGRPRLFSGRQRPPGAARW
eukprot:scaffold10559_cov77-Phaeocystis_antarctica.AAC.2